MSPLAQALEIIPIDRVEIALEPWSWEFAVKRREEIERHFADRQRERPAIWNGRVILLNRYEIEGGLLRGASFETDFASFLAWRDWGCPDATVFNVFSVAALQAADGAYLVGEMADSTASAGQLYFPCGTPDPKDISAKRTLDLARSVSRELLEETGIDIATLAAEPGWCLVRDGGFIAVLKRLTAPQSAEALRSRIMRFLANERQPEFSDLHIVRGSGDLDPRMPAFVVAFLENVWRQ
jgi:hypothetical protein